MFADPLEPARILRPAFSETPGRYRRRQLEERQVRTRLEDRYRQVDTGARILVAEGEGLDALPFYPGALHSVVAVHRLGQIAERVTDVPVVTDHDIFQSMDEASPNVHRLGNLDFGVDKTETVAASHGVEEKFLSKATEIRVLHETSRFRPKSSLVTRGSVRRRDPNGIRFPSANRCPTQTDIFGKCG